MPPKVSTLAPLPAVAVMHSYVANTASMAPDITAGELATLLNLNVSTGPATYAALPAAVQRHFKIP